MNRYFILFFLSSCVAWVVSVAAEFQQEISEPAEISHVSETINDIQAVELALTMSKKRESLETNVHIAEHRLDSAGGINNPELRLSDITNRYFSDEPNELRVGLRWRSPRYSELSEEKQRAAVQLWEKKVLADRYKSRLINRVQRAYANVLMLDEQVELAGKRLDLETKRLEIVEQMVDLGRRSVVYMSKSRIWLSESRNEHIKLVKKQGDARRKLANMTGLTANAVLEPQILPEITDNLDRLLAIALENRSETRLVQEKKELAVQKRNLERGKNIPRPRFIDLSYHTQEQDDNWTELRIGIEIPLFNWNRGNIRAMNLAVEKRESETEAIREVIKAEVRDALNQYRDDFIDWQNYEQVAFEMIKNTKTLINQVKEHDNLPPDEVMELELMIIETRKTLSEKRRRMAYSLFDLFYILGLEDPSRILD
jgi:outer membrane protein TolC